MAPLLIGALMDSPASYRIPIFRALAERYGILTDLYYRCQGSVRGWGALDRIYPYVMSPTLRIAGGRIVAPPVGLVAGILRRRYGAVIIGGWGHCAYLVLHLMCHAVGMPVVAASDTGVGRSRTELGAWVRRKMLRRILSWADTALVAGRLSQRHLVRLGFTGTTRLGYYAVDCRAFVPSSTRSREGSLSIMFAGRLIERKRLLDLLRALSLVRHKGIPADLVVVGDGPRRHSCESLVGQIGIAGHVSFKGAVCHHELPRLMQRADVLVVPSENEPWGVVLAEAAASGLAIIASDQVGAAVDIVREGENGYAFCAGDVRGLACALQKLWRDKKAGRLTAMGQVSRRMAESFSLENCTSAYASAIRDAVAHEGYGRKAAGAGAL